MTIHADGRAEGQLVRASPFPRHRVYGNELAVLGVGPVLGERSMLEGGRSSAKIRAVTPCKLVAVAVSAIDRDALERLAPGRRRENEPG